MRLVTLTALLAATVKADCDADGDLCKCEDDGDGNMTANCVEYTNDAGDGCNLTGDGQDDCECDHDAHTCANKAADEPCETSDELCKCENGEADCTLYTNAAADGCKPADHGVGDCVCDESTKDCALADNNALGAGTPCTKGEADCECGDPGDGSEVCSAVGSACDSGSHP